MQLLGRWYEGRVAVREWNGNPPSTRTRHRSLERFDFGKLQLHRSSDVFGQCSRIRALAFFARIASILVTLFVLTHGAAARGAVSVTLAWNPSPDSSVTGYHVYYGTASHSYTGMVAVGVSATATVSGLTEGTTYYFAVTAIDSLGLESGYSNEIQYSVPATGSRLRLLSPVAPNGMVIRITGPPGQTYEVQATQNFVNWTVIGVVTLGVGGVFDFTDVNASKFRSRFYRLYANSRPRLQLLSAVAPSGMTIRITGPPGQTYEVQATQDFTNWAVIGVVTLGAGGLFDFSDVNASKFRSRFYRLRAISLPHLQLLPLTPTSGPVLRITGEPGHTYEIQATQDFINWAVIGNVTLDVSGVFDFTDANASKYRSRFYRVRDVL